MLCTPHGPLGHIMGRSHFVYHVSDVHGWMCHEIENTKVNKFYVLGFALRHMTNGFSIFQCDWHAIKGLSIIHLGYEYPICTLNDYWVVGIYLSHW